MGFLRARLLALLCLLLASISILWAAFRPEGPAERVRALENDVQSVASENSRLAEGNRKLLEQVTALRRQGPYLEGVIRRDLGMVHDGEIVVRVAPQTTPHP